MEKKIFKFYTIADYEEEEQWLMQMAEKGWKLIHTNAFIYTFESCEPQKLVYRIEYRQKNDDSYLQMIQDYGWQQICVAVKFHYYCRPYSENIEENEIFSDNESRVNMIQSIIRTRLLVIVCCSFLPAGNIISTRVPSVGPLYVIYNALFTILVALITHCFIKLSMLKKRYSK